MSLRADTTTSSGLHPDISLGSLDSSLVTPYSRRPSTMSGTTAATPSPNGGHKVSTGPALDGDEDDSADIAKTPGPASRHARTRSSVGTTKSGVNLTLREQEKVRLH